MPFPSVVVNHSHHRLRTLSSSYFPVCAFLFVCWFYFWQVSSLGCGGCFAKFPPLPAKVPPPCSACKGRCLPWLIGHHREKKQSLCSLELKFCLAFRRSSGMLYNPCSSSRHQCWSQLSPKRYFKSTPSKFSRWFMALILLMES